VALAVKSGKSAREMVGADKIKAAKKAKSAADAIAGDVDDAIAGFLDGEKAEDEDDSDVSEEEDSEEANAKIDDELDDLVEKRRKEERIDAKKTANRQKKQEWRKKLSLNVQSGGQDEPELLRATNKLSIKALEEQDDYIDPALRSEDEEEASEEDEEDSDSDEELDRYARMEVDLAIGHALKGANDAEKFRSQVQRKMKKKKETRRERVMAAWSGELMAFNNALDDQAYKQHLVDNRVSDEEDDDDDSDDDGDVDLKTLRLSQSAAFKSIDYDSMEASLGGPQLSIAARELLEERTQEPKKRKVAKDDDDLTGDEDETALATVAAEGQDQLKEQHRASRWFSQDIFKSVGAGASSSSKEIIPLDRDSSAEEEEDGVMQEYDDKDLPKMPLTDKEKRKILRKKEMEKLERLGKKPVKDNTPMEVAAQEAPVKLNMSGPHKPSDPREHAETLALGTLLTDNKKSRMDLIDASYNRWTFDGDEALPDWFTEDENKHNKPELPITKEMMATFAAKLREINARPIRKVAEAKARKGRRLKLRLEKLRKTAMSLADTPDMSETAKARMMRKQVSKAMRQDQRAVTTVAIKKGGGGTRGKKEGKTPKGAKVKVVDRRMKSDTRSEKKAVKRAGAGGRAKVRGKMQKQQRKQRGAQGKTSGGGRAQGQGLQGQGV